MPSPENTSQANTHAAKKTSKKVEKRLVSDEELATLPRAGLLRRLAALLYDMFLVGGIWVTLGFIILMLYGLVGDNTSELVDGAVQTSPILSLLQLVMMVTTVTGFYLYFWRRTGQTLGMIAWRIRVINNANQPLTVRQGLIRFFLAWPAFWLAGLGYLWMYIDKQGDAIHETLSDTKTVLLPKQTRPF